MSLSKTLKTLLKKAQLNCVYAQNSQGSHKTLIGGHNVICDN